MDCVCIKYEDVIEAYPVYFSKLTGLLTGKGLNVKVLQTKEEPNFQKILDACKIYRTTIVYGVDSLDEDTIFIDSKKNNRNYIFYFDKFLCKFEYNNYERFGEFLMREPKEDAETIYELVTEKG